MATGIIIPNTGKKICINRIFKDTPDYTAPSVFRVGTGTTTPTAADTDLEIPVTIAGNPTKAFSAGYPIIDETNFQSTLRGVLLTSEANGNTLTEFGSFNTDGTRLLFSRLVHTAIAKTSSIQVIYVEKDKLS